MVSNIVYMVYSAMNPRIVVKSRKNILQMTKKLFGACASISLHWVSVRGFPTFLNTLTLMHNKKLQFIFFGLGCSRKNPAPLPHPRRMEFWKFLWEVGSKALEMQAGGVLHLKKSSAGDISTDSSCNSNIQFGDTSAFSDPGNSRNILFTYFSP